MPQKHKVHNWSEYNNSLKKRGDIFFFIEEKSEDKRERNQQYGEASIIMCQQIRYIFKMPYRQTQGFMKSLAARKLIGKVPDYSTMCRRAKALKIKINDRRKNKEEAAVVAIDSTDVMSKY